MTEKLNNNRKGNYMIKDNQQFLNRIQVVLDAVIVYLSFYLSYVIRFSDFVKESGIFVNVPYYRTFPQYQRMLPVAVIIFLIIYSRFNLYKPKRFQNRGEEAWDLIRANTTGMLIILLLIYVFRIEHVPRSLLLIFYIVCTLLTILVRHCIRLVLRGSRRRGYNLKHVIVVGYSAAAEAYIDRTLGNPQWGYMIHGIFDDSHKKGFSYKDIKCIGYISELQKYIEANDLDEVIITLSIKEYNKLESIVKLCEKSGVHTKFIPDYYKFIPTNPVTEDLNGLPVINIRNVPLNNVVNKTVKRIFDFFGSLVCIVIFSPIMIATAIAVKRSSPGPIIFTQERVGLHNKPFKMYKFRSMGVQPPSKEKEMWTVHNDPRVTKVGRIIRKTSIDELPQLFNVLKGDMSLIGPRPERPLFVEKFKEEIPRYMIKHQVRPGMTGWAQVCGFRGDTSIEGRIQHDIFYIENWSFMFDIKILFLTVFKGFVNENAY